MRSKPLFLARRMIAAGSAAASASPAPAQSAGVHPATTVSPSTAVPPGNGWYPISVCTKENDGWELADPYTGEVWRCGYLNGEWQWYPTGEYVCSQMGGVDGLPDRH
jgi:hypothetical protein